MIRKLLATTAMAGLFATGAFAQETTTPAPAAPAAQGTMESGTAAPASGSQANAAGQAGYIQTLSAQQHLVSELDGKEIYSGAGQDAQSLGSIENWLVEQDGTVSHAIVQASVNDQSRTVAVPFSQIKWSMDEGNEPRATIDSADTLAKAPTFVERQQTAAADPAVMGGTTAPAGSVASTTTAPAAGGAMTPAPATGDMAATSAAPAAGMAPATGTEMAAGTAASGETMMQGENQFLTSNLMDQDVRTGMGDDAETIGKMSDFVVSDSGKVDAAIVGVGGFLGIGQKNVAVPFADFQVSRNEDGQPSFVLAATKEQLEQAQAFEGREQTTAANTTAGMGNDMAATGAAAGAAAGAAMGGAMNAAETAANNAGTAIGNAADGAMNSAETAANDAGAAVTGAATGAAAGATTMAQNQNGMATTGTDPSTTASTGNSATEGMTEIQGSEQLTAEQLDGTTVYGPNDESIGKVGDIALNADGRVDAVIVDVGGFLGIGAKPVAVGLDNVRMMRDQGDRVYIYTEFSKDQLENAPAYDRATYAENRDTMRMGSQNAAPAAPAAGSTTAN